MIIAQRIRRPKDAQRRTAAHSGAQRRTPDPVLPTFNMPSFTSVGVAGAAAGSSSFAELEKRAGEERHLEIRSSSGTPMFHLRCPTSTPPEGSGKEVIQPCLIHLHVSSLWSGKGSV